MPTESSIVLNDLIVSFGAGESKVNALDGASLEVFPGEMIALLGASGSGKSTLLNVIAGLQPIVSGTAVVLGERVDTLSEEERSKKRLTQIGYVFQDNNLIPSFSVLENVQLPLFARGWRKKRAEREAMKWLEIVGVDHLADRLPQDMSGGQRQRVGVARALAGDRKILLADEPTGALDSENTALLFELLSSLANRGKTVVIATHDPYVHNYTSNIFRIKDGQVVVDNQHSMSAGDRG